MKAITSRSTTIASPDARWAFPAGPPARNGSRSLP